MPISNRLTRRLGLTHPIIQAPLAGGGDTPDLVAAVCNAGALGFIAAAYLTPPQIIDTSRAVPERTSRPFGIKATKDGADVSAALFEQFGQPTIEGETRS